MKGTLIVMSSNREMEQATKETVRALSTAGAIRLMETGSSDVAFARCRALSWACEKLREFTDRDLVLMMDDDMEVPLEVAQLLADKARELGCTCFMSVTDGVRKVAFQTEGGRLRILASVVGCA